MEEVGRRRRDHEAGVEESVRSQKTYTTRQEIRDRRHFSFPVDVISNMMFLLATITSCKAIETKKSVQSSCRRRPQVRARFLSLEDIVSYYSYFRLSLIFSIILFSSLRHFLPIQN